MSPVSLCDKAPSQDRQDADFLSRAVNIVRRLCSGIHLHVQMSRKWMYENKQVKSNQVLTFGGRGDNTN